MSWINDFKTFALKGNVVDLAIAVIIGMAFGKVVSSLVADIIMPPIGVLLGQVDFSSLQAIIKPATAASAAVSIKYGMFINTLIDFLIISLTIFIVIKAMSKLKKEKPVDPTTRDCPECLSTIPLKAKKCKYCASTLKKE